MSKQKSWLQWRNAWYGFEDIIVDSINDYKNNINWMRIVDFIANDLKIKNLNEYYIYAIKSPHKVKSRFWWAMVSPKSDIHIIFEKDWEKIKKWISIKSSNWSIQIQITNVENFRNIVEKNWINFSDELYIWLSKFCWFGEYKPSKILTKWKILNNFEKECIKFLEENTKIPENEIEKINCVTKLFSWLKQSRRNRWLINELTNEERFLIKKFFNQNQRKITSIVLKEWSSKEEYFADYYLINNNEYSKTGKIDLSIENMEKVIDNCIKTWYTETEEWSFHIWKLTVQMKWSWKWEAFHGLQFNKRW